MKYASVRATHQVFDRLHSPNYYHLGHCVPALVHPSSQTSIARGLAPKRPISASRMTLRTKCRRTSDNLHHSACNSLVENRYIFHSNLDSRLTESSV